MLSTLLASLDEISGEALGAIQAAASLRELEDLSLIHI